MKLKQEPQRRIMVIDDIMFSRQFIASVLRGEGFTDVDTLESGQIALEHLNAGVIPTLVITDLTMPGMNGLQLLKKVRMGETRAPRGLPVGLLTGYAEKILVQTAVRLDADAFLAKPVTAEVLVRNVTRMLDNGPAPEIELKSVDVYGDIEVDDRVEELLTDEEYDFEGGRRVGPGVRKSEMAASAKKIEVEVEEAAGVPVRLSEVPDGARAARDVVTGRGNVLVKSGTTMTQRSVNRLISLNELGEIGNTVWIHAEDLPADEDGPI